MAEGAGPVVVPASAGPTRAKLFWNGRSQAVRLPKEFRFAGDEVAIRRAEHGRLRFVLRNRPIGERDLLIAATALAHGLGVVTHSTREFGRVPGLAVEDWSE